MLTVVGPALGYGLGGAFLGIYVDPWLETNLEPTDPGWVGAWWLCFIFCGVLSWILAVPFLMFPRLLPNSEEVKKERLKEMAQKFKGKYSTKEDADLLTKLKSFPYHLKQVVMTLSWVFITAAICSSIIVLAGMVSFAPKYLESQFTLTASTASLIAGAVGKCSFPSPPFLSPLLSILSPLPSPLFLLSFPLPPLPIPLSPLPLLLLSPHYSLPTTSLSLPHSHPCWWCWSDSWCPHYLLHKIQRSSSSSNQLDCFGTDNSTSSSIPCPLSHTQLGWRHSTLL